MWITLGIISSLFLGSYDIFKKWSLNDNAVIPVLFFATLSGAAIFLPMVVTSWYFPHFSSQQVWYLPPQSMHAHLLFLAKSLLVGTSWILAYFALKNLPITIVTPIRASAPLWTLLGALLIYGERFNFWQWSGIMITIGSYYLFSLASLKEGIAFKNNKWVALIFLATILGAASSLYDKYLVNHYDRLAMQAWFSLYLVIFYLPVLLFWFPGRNRTTPFQWRWSIVFIGLFLIIADFTYFYALTFHGAKIGIIAPLRRGSVVVSFLLGGLIFREKNIGLKSLVLFGIFLGILLIFWGS